MRKISHSDPATTPGRSGGQLYFNAILHPQRSLGQRQFRLLMAALCVVAGTVGLIFTAAGAWPVASPAPTDA
jgi:uncharacterized membrane protein